MLKPKHLNDGKTHKAYLWLCCTTPFNATKAVVQSTDSRSGENAQQFLKLDTPHALRGTLVTDGFSGYIATPTKGVTSAVYGASTPQGQRPIGQPRQRGRRPRSCATTRCCSGLSARLRN